MPTRPNIILIMADEFRVKPPLFRRSSCVKTHCLDSLASDSVDFSRLSPCPSRVPAPFRKPDSLRAPMVGQAIGDKVEWNYDTALAANYTRQHRYKLIFVYSNIIIRL